MKRSKVSAANVNEEDEAVSREISPSPFIHTECRSSAGGGAKQRGLYSQRGEGRLHCNNPPPLSLCPPRSDPALLPGLLPVPGRDVCSHHVRHAADARRLQAHLAGPPGHSR